MNPDLARGTWIEARYALLAPDGRLVRGLRLNFERGEQREGLSASSDDGRYDPANLAALLFPLLATLGADQLTQSGFTAWLAVTLRSFDSLAGRLTAAIMREAPAQWAAIRTSGSPEVMAHLDLDFGPPFAISLERLTVEMAEYHSVGLMRTWLYPGNALRDIVPGQEGGVLKVWLDVAVERFGARLVRDLDARAISLPPKRR
jgi:hypothetical protein